MTKQEFAQKIKIKYPQYQNIEDEQLADKILAKYPQYQNSIDESSPAPFQSKQFLSNLMKSTVQKQEVAGEKIARTLLPKGVEKFGETLGGIAATQTRAYKEAAQSQVALEDMNVKLGEAIIGAKKQGKDTSRMERMYQENTGQRFNMRDIISETADKTAKQIYGEGLTTAGTMLMGASPLKSAAKRIGFGGALGTTFGTAKALREDKDAGNIVTSGILGGITGLVISGAFETLGKVAKHIFPGFQKHAYTKELQPPSKELVKQIEKGFQTFGENVRNLKDASGKAVYQGTYTTMQKQATKQLSTKGKALMNIAKKYDKTVSINRNQVASDIITQLQNTFGKLKNSQIEAIKFEINRMPAKMNVTEMIKSKRMYDALIPDSFWIKAGDSNVTFVTQVKYILRDNLRKTINNNTKENVVKTLNNELSIAMDMKHLTSEQIAKRIKQKISGEGGYFYKLIGRFIDDYLFNPWITTGVSQRALRAGQMTGQTPLRAGARNLTIEEITRLNNPERSMDWVK